MSPELLSAVQERIQIGHTKIEIQKELEAAGYSPEMIEEIYETAQQTGVSSSVPTEESLVSSTQLVKAGWALLKEKWKLFVKSFAVSFGLFVLLGIGVAGGAFALVGMDGALTDSVAILLLASLSLLIVAVAFLLGVRVVSFSVIRNLTRQGESETFTQSLRWSMQHIVPVVVVGLSAYFAVQTGYLFFLIPGIVAAVYFYFASYIFAAEGIRGVDALVRSTELVYGRWWGVVGRLLTVFLLFFAVGLVFVVLASFIVGALNPNMDESSWVVAPVLLVGLGLLLSLIAFFQCITFVLFSSLRASAQSQTFTPEGKKKLRFWIKAMVILGPFAAIILQSMSVLSEREEQPAVDFAGGSEIALRQELNDMYYRGESYFANAGNFSYVGVCAEIEPGITTGTVEVCNETPDAWALFVNDGAETWCSDSTGFRKQSNVQLGDSTECLLLPDADELEEVIGD